MDDDGILEWLESVRPGWGLQLRSRLEGTPPAGSLPASGSGARGAAPDQARDTDTSSAPPFGGQATGELQRLIQHLEKRAAEQEAHGRRFARKGMDLSKNFAIGMAAGLRAAIADLEAGAVGEPRAQSGEEGAEECWVRNNARFCVASQDWRINSGRCLACPARGKRVERSGPPNSQPTGR